MGLSRGNMNNDVDMIRHYDKCIHVHMRKMLGYRTNTVFDVCSKVRQYHSFLFHLSKPLHFFLCANRHKVRSVLVGMMWQTRCFGAVFFLIERHRPLRFSKKHRKQRHPHRDAITGLSEICRVRQCIDVGCDLADPGEWMHDRHFFPFQMRGGKDVL